MCAIIECKIYINIILPPQKCESIDSDRALFQAAIRIEDNIIKGSATVTQKEQLFHPNTQTMHLIRIYIKIAQYARNKVTICNWSRPFFFLLTEE